MFGIKTLLNLFAYLLLLVPGLVYAGPACCAAVDADQIPVVRDDLAYAGLAEAIGASLSYLKRQPPSKLYRFCDRSYSPGEVAAGLVDFITLVERKLAPEEFGKQFGEKFELCAAAADEGVGGVLVTGYFEPLLEGSLQKEPPFIYPLYKRPDDLLQKDGRIGRLQEGGFVLYWTRGEIENGGVLAGNELVYVKDPVEAFILHVQGSGRIRLRDGQVRRIQFAAKNGRPYRSIGKLLVDQGKMELAEVSLPTIADYLEAHPRERREILQSNQSFIFFRWGESGDSGPLGRLGEPLTAGRSVALDHECFPPGALAFLETRKPIFNGENEIIGWAPLRRFVVNQDSGSAIKGGRRVDLFLGAGERARAMAGVMKHPGKLYFPVAKK